MKLLIALCTTATLLCTTFSFAKDKKTLIDRIEEADSIPVFLEYGKVKAGKYSEAMQKIPLTVAESKKKYVDGVIPSIVDTNQRYIVDQLNSRFNTMKFYLAATGSKDEIDKIVTENQISFCVYAKFFAQFSYPAIHAQRDGQSKRLVATVNMQLSCFLDFNTLKDSPQPVKRLATVISGNISQILIDGLITTADEFMKVKSPLTLTSKTMSNLDAKLLKFSKKHMAKHEKIVSKRK